MNRKTTATLCSLVFPILAAACTEEADAIRAAENRGGFTNVRIIDSYSSDLNTDSKCRGLTTTYEAFGDSPSLGLGRYFHICCDLFGDRCTITLGYNNNYLARVPQTER